MSDGKVTIDTRLDSKGFINGLGKMKNSISGLKNSLLGVDMSLKKLAGLAATAFSIRAIKNFADESKALYQTQMENELKLETIMRQRIGATDDMIQSVKDLTSAEQKLGVIGDEVQLAGAQQIATFSTQTNTIKTLIPAMNNLLAQQNGLNSTTGDAVNIGNLMGKVLQGQTGALKRVGISFSDAEEQVLKYGTEEERASMLAKVITNNVGNMNYALAQTDAGKSQQLANTMGDVKEQFGKAFQTISSLFIPSLSRVALLAQQAADSFISLSNVLAETFGGKTVKNTQAVSSGVDSIADATDDATESTEALADAQKGLSGLDELNVISSSASTSTSASASTSDSATSGIANTVAEETEGTATKSIEKFKEAWENADFSFIGEKIGAGLKFGLDIVANNESLIVSSCQKIGTSIASIINGAIQTEGLGNSIGEAIGVATNGAVAINNAFFRDTEWDKLGEQIADVFNGLSERVSWDEVGASFTVKTNALFETINGFAKELEWDEVGENIVSGIAGFFDEADWGLYAETLSNLLTGLGDALIGLVSSVNFEEIPNKILTAWVDFFENVNWAGILSTISKIIRTLIKARIQWYKGIAKLIIGVLKEVDFSGIANIIAKPFKVAWSTIKTVFSVVGTWFKTNVVSKIKSAFSGITTWFKTIFTTAWTNIKSAFSGVWNWFRTNIYDKITGALSGIGSWFLNLGSTAWSNLKAGFSAVGSFFSSVVSAVKKPFSGIANWFKTTFTTAWTNVKNVFSKGGKVFKGITDGILSAFKSVVNTLIEGINEVVSVPFDGINSALKSIKNIKIVGKKPFNFIDTVPVPKIPKLATGAVLPANNPFMAMVGDQKHGTNIEAPLDTIVEAVKIALGNQQQQVVFKVEGDVNKIFKVTQEQASSYTKRTGRPAF